MTTDDARAPLSLLLVDDEESLAESLAFSLEKHGYKVTKVADGGEALTLLESFRPDLILLDVMLPGKDGFEVCRAVQKMEPSIPIIMITARTSETDRVVGLEMGADDYVTKPFSTRELEARIKAVLRRRNLKQTMAAAKLTLEIDLDRRIAKRGEQPLQLSPREWEVLSCLMARKGSPVSKEDLLKEVWGENFVGDPKTVEIHVHWLRQKLEKNPSLPEHVITLKRKGYAYKD